ncbi:type II secretion system protein GspK [Luteimonas sp BLCC-B24]|uniref:general secretion pathway protein GspK n=1 Tax=Luteimonas sp. BLCC-B24 TaxID=3025317 RepID=UPI00234C832F|nr:type II secretion system protein GspK [Luteimonas sp. BLCC-B24]MDC7807813.1 type II secretion system protein GspK [Luteimonas sp. BLCC-B24]
MNTMRGAALLLVLWLITLLAALVGAFALTARIENQQGRLVSRGLVADQAARAGLEYALTRLASSDPTLQWQPDGRPYAWRFHDAEVELRIVDETGKVDLNAADGELLAALARAVGADQDAAVRVAGAIVDWRDGDDFVQVAGGAESADYAAAGRPYGAKNALFESVAEVEQVLGMTPALFEVLAPHLTIYSRLPAPDPQFAAAEVLQAMGVDADPVLEARAAGAAQRAGALLGSGSGTYSIDSRARLEEGRSARLRAVVRTGGGAVPGTAYSVLRWEEGASPR